MEIELAESGLRPVGHTQKSKLIPGDFAGERAHPLNVNSGLFVSSRQERRDFVKNFTKRLACHSGRCFHDVHPPVLRFACPHPPSRRRRVSIAVE
jgi:hypothetical protein